MLNRGYFEPIYMPFGIRVAAIVFALLIASPVLIHMWAHAALMLRGVATDNLTSDWPQFFQLVLAAGVAFPDPVVRMIRAYRGRKTGETGERETPQ